MKPFILKEYLTRLLLALLLFQAVLLCAFEVYNIAAIREREKASLWHILSLYENELEEGMEQTDHDLGDILSRKYQLQILKSSSDLRRSYAGRELQEDMESRLRGNGYADAYVILDRTHGEYIMARSSDISYEETGALREFFLERMGAGQGNSGWTMAELSTGRCLVHYFNYGGGGTLVGAVVSLRTLEEIIGAGQNGVLRFALYDREGKLQRIAIITTNSCTNIKTYANLKYMNQVFLRDQFLMIRDGDGQDPEELAGRLCRYYEERNLEDADRLPRVTRRNVLILKYYSFENYFLNPAVMTKLGIVESEETFYRTLYEKWREYLCRLRSGRMLIQVLGRDLQSPEDVRDHMEEIRIHLRGHNLYDIFYGPFRKEETELLRSYIRLAPREDFKDILDAAESFPFFDSRRAT